jgi:HAD superfamily hydrolase (TIGR01509 family)
MNRSKAKQATPVRGAQGNTKNEATRSVPAFLFDLDGTLVDSVYQHVLAWREALEKAGIELSVWRIHRRIGMSGGLFVNALLRETGHKVSADEAARLQRMHAEAYARLVAQVRPLPGARELLAYLTQAQVPWAIATSGRLESAGPALKILGIDSKAPVITRDQVQYAKPDPDLFLAAAGCLGASVSTSIVVGDSVWDLLAARRASALGEWVCFRADTARMNWSALAHTAFTRIPPICCGIWTRSGFGLVSEGPHSRCDGSKLCLPGD